MGRNTSIRLYLKGNTMLDTNVVNLRQIIQNYRLVIPRYQRPYAWEEEQMIDLWNDIRDTWLIRNQVMSDLSKHNHFMGSILTTSVPDGHAGQMFVIDGQQRMTSLTIFAAALLDVCIQNHVRSPIFKNIFGERPSLFITLNEGHEFMYKIIIEPSRAEQSFDARTKAISHNKAITDVHINIRENYKAVYNAINQFIADLSAVQRRDHLSGILETFLDYIYVVRIHVPNDANIIRIFRTLNDRGVDLSQGDIAKSIIFESVLHNQYALDNVSKLWQETFEQLDGDSSVDIITSYLRHFYISHWGYVAEGNLTSYIQDFISKPSPVANMPPAVYLTEGMREEASHYNTLLQSNTQFTQTNEHITIIRECLQVTLSFPALLAAMTRWYNHPVTLNKFLQLTEHFLFRYFHIQAYKSIPTLESFMSDVAKIIRTHQDALPIIQKMYQEKSSDTSFFNAFLTASIGKSTLTRYVFWKIEQSDQLSLNTVLSGKDFKLNMLMPRSPNSEFSRADIDLDYYKRIGNQFLWGSKLKLNKSLSFLQNQSKTSMPISLTSIHKAMQEHKTWGPNAIDARQTILAELAKNIWTLS
jgi:hypothetical protein